MTELIQAQTALADERAKFEDEATQLRANCAAAERLHSLASSLFGSFAQRRHDHLKPFEDRVRAAAKVKVGTS